MKHYCTVPMNIEKNKDGDLKYVFCGNEATHLVYHSDWFVCEPHANTLKLEGYYLIPIEEVMDDQIQGSKCEQIGELAKQDERKS